MFCSGGHWEAEPTAAFSCSIAWDLCTASPDAGTCVPVREEVSESVPEETGFDGQPGCEGKCGYRFVYDWKPTRDSAWLYAPDLECPLQTSRCSALQDELGSIPAVCDTDADCTLLDGQTDCDNVFEPPLYTDSEKLSDDEREQRASIWSQILAAGCGGPTGYDGPIREVGCIDGTCQLRVIGVCNDLLELDGGIEPDAGARLNDGGTP